MDGDAWLALVFFGFMGAVMLALGVGLAVSWARGHETGGDVDDVAGPTWLEGCRAERMIVHTVHDRSIDGLLEHADDDGLVLVQAKYLGGEGVDLGGRVFIPREQVALVQVV